MAQTQLASMFIGQTPDASVLAQRKKQPALIHLLDDKVDEVLAVIGKHQKFWGDLHKQKLKNNVEAFEFVTSSSGPANQHLQVGKRPIIPTEDGFFREFIINETVQKRNELKVYSSGSFIELKKEKPIAPATYTGATLNTMLDAILYGTGWRRGITDYSGTQKIKWDKYYSPYDALQLLPTAFDIELRFRIEQDGPHIYRFVDAVKRTGYDNGKEIVSGKDLLQAKRRETTKNQVTALVGLGPEKEDGTRLVVEVTDEDALQSWGRNGRHKWGIYEPESDRQDMTLEELERYTRTELNKRKATTIEYIIDALNISSIFNRPHEYVGLGDGAKVKVTDYNPPIYLDSRIISTESPITDRTRKTFVLGEFIEHSEEDINKLRKQLLGKIAGKTSIVYQATPPGDTTVTWGDTSEGGGFKRYAADVGLWLPQADVTSEHTAKDTANVAGRPSKTIEDKAGAQEKASKALEDAKADAQTKANAAQTAAEEYALAKANLAETQAKAHADGKVSAEEQARIDADTAKLNEAKAHAETKANEAEAAAEAYTDSRLTNYVTATLYDSEMSDLQAQIDNQVQSHFYDYEPSLTNVPASNWTTTTEKDKHIGDLFFDTDKGHSYRFAKQNGNYRWVQVRDEGIAKALEDAAQAQDTADNKRRVFVAQPTTPYDKGDLWNDNKKIKQSTVAKTDSAVFSNSDWVLIGDVTGENTSQDTQYVDGRPAKTIEDVTGSQLKVDDLEISDRNLLLDTSGKWITKNMSADNHYFQQETETKLEVGQTYTFSVLVKKESNDTVPVQINTGAGVKNGFNADFNWSPKKGLEQGEYDLFTDTFTQSQSNEDRGYIYFGWRIRNNQLQTTISYKNEKLQKGSKATDWTPAPEDVEKAYKEVSKAEAELARTKAKAYADDQVSAEEQARIDQAEANLQEAKQYANTKANQAEDNAKSHADTVSGQALVDAKNYAVAKEVYDTKMTEIADDLGDKAGIEYVDGELVSKADKADTYTITDVDNALSNKVSVTQYQTGMDGVVQDLNTHSTLIGQNEDAIALKADSSRVDTIEGTVSDHSSELSVMSDEISSKVEADYVSGELDKLQVGGRNLLLGTSDSWTVESRPASSYYFQKETDTRLEVGETYTFGILVRKESNDDVPVSVNVGVGEKGGFRSDIGKTSQKSIVQGDTHFFAYSFTHTQSNDDAGYNYFAWRIRNERVATTIAYKNVKLDKGNKATDWTPAPEDTQEQIDDLDVRVTSSETSITQNADEIELKATKTALDTVEGRVSSAESTITQQANEIDSRVRKDDIISVINQTPELIKISANKLGLEGYAKFTDLSTEGQTTIHGGNLITSSMKWDVGRGGTMMLGGLNNGNGVFIVQDDEGENVVELDAADKGFQEVRIGNVLSSSVVKTNYDDYTIEINPSYGDLWQDAINSIPKYNEGDVTVRIVGSSGNTSENVLVTGFVGGGSITFDIQTSRPKIDGTFKVTRNQNRIYASGFDVNATESPGVVTNASPGSQIDDVTVYSNGNSVGFENQNGSVVFSNLQAYEVDRCIRSSYASHLTVFDGKGYGNVTGIEARFGGIITGGGTAPDAAQYPAYEDDGKILTSFTHDAGSATPPAPPEQTKRFKAIDAGAWRSNGGWVKDQPLQGEWSGYGPYKGLWIFDGLGAELTGKTIKRMRILVKREARGGYSSDVGIRFRTHNYTSIPGGEPTLGNDVELGDFAWGEERWENIRSSLFPDFENGNAEGIGIYSGTGYYAYMSASATLEVTYQ